MTRFIKGIMVVMVSLGGLIGCQTPPPRGITQVSTLSALEAGVYDGHMSLEQLRAYGDFGVGTFEGLNGEMILLNGEFYQALGRGEVVQPLLNLRTPFACVSTFVPDRWATLRAGMDQDALKERIDALVPPANRVCAFMVQGRFKAIRVRSVPEQKRPYPPLAEVVKTQAVFPLTEVSGTLIGFRVPEFLKGLNQAGYHFHFLSDDHAQGGHVLDFELDQGTLAVDTVHDWLHIYFPPHSAAFDEADLSYPAKTEVKEEKNKIEP